MLLSFCYILHLADRPKKKGIKFIMALNFKIVYIAKKHYFYWLILKI
jgi:hypothetical protein